MINKTKKTKNIIYWILVIITISTIILSVLTKGPNSNHNEDIQVIATVDTIKRISKALKKFQDIYNALPGDMIDVKILPGCKETECTSGNGDGKINLNNKEEKLFWNHLFKSGLLNKEYHFKYLQETGTNLPSTPLGGYFHAYSLEKKQQNIFPVKYLAPGTWLVISNKEYGALKNNEPFISSLQAALIDAKLDDREPSRGTVQSTGKAICFKKLGKSITYKESNKKCLSLLYIRIGI